MDGTASPQDAYRAHLTPARVRIQQVIYVGLVASLIPMATLALHGVHRGRPAHRSIFHPRPDGFDTIAFAVALVDLLAALGAPRWILSRRRFRKTLLLGGAYGDPRLAFAACHRMVCLSFLIPLVLLEGASHIALTVVLMARQSGALWDEPAFQLLLLPVAFTVLYATLRFPTRDRLASAFDGWLRRAALATPS